MSIRRKLIAGNWKMNGTMADSADLAGALADRWMKGPRPDCDLLVCPPFPLIVPVVAALAGTEVAVGAQDCHAKPAGAHTGDVAAPLLSDLGCRAVIVGHSERRADHGETDAIVKAKAEAALSAGLIAIVCVGETLEQREAGRTLEVNRSQLRGSLPVGATAANIVIAYEPVWAIGTGRVATPAQAQEVHAVLRTELALLLGEELAAATRILYGGSMKPDNAAELLSLADVDGGLIGGASLKAADFWAIAAAC
ncbi:triose-phosphate isomerase [Magnetospirillum molischianum]|uniref:Triosephosphate isomerase n=1 Tax=Magnetospirillum molischianum DSM 120 TaxID=1150626 RepID=H8FV76_MAGML|nr:triose-phosphate isomerase [Magnetospirillum molischianum]CCG42264.1 Triosephosphate isomerase (TIM) (Triose-phosphate isomerase) [Magnetospirillum molischianum DSM 120]